MYIYIYSLVKHFKFYVPTQPKYSFASETPPFLHINWTKIFLHIIKNTISMHQLDQSIRLHPWHLYSTYLLDQDILSHPWHSHFYISTRPKYSIASSTPQFLRIYLTRIFYCNLHTSSNFFVSTQPKHTITSSTPQFLHINSTDILYRILNTSISSYLLDQNIPSHPQHLHFFVPNWPEYSIASSTSPFLRINSTDVIFHCILDNSVSSYLLDQNIPSHPWHLHFYVSTWPEYSTASLTPAFLHIYSTEIFFRISDTSISTYLLDQNILPHPSHLYFYVSTRPRYSFTSAMPPNWRVNSTKIFYHILDNSFSSYLHDRNILSHPQHLNFFVSTWPEYSIGSLTPPFLCIFSTRIFYRILDTSISLYLLDQNIPSHPWHLHFYVSTWPKYSFASVTTPYLRINRSKIFFSILKTSISTFPLDQNIHAHPRHLNFYVSTRPKYSCASVTPPILCTYSTKIFLRTLDSTSSMYMLLLNQNILVHTRFLHFYVSTRQKYSCSPLISPFLCTYSTKIFLHTLDSSFYMHQLDHNILSHPWHLHFYVPTRPKYSCASSIPPFQHIYLTITRSYYATLAIAFDTSCYVILGVTICVNSYGLIRVVQCLPMFFGSMDVVLGLIDHHICPPLWNNCRSFESRFNIY